MMSDSTLDFHVTKWLKCQVNNLCINHASAYPYLIYTYYPTKLLAYLQDLSFRGNLEGYQGEVPNINSA
jgi:hypothetical protein